jgi:outer membrane biosynthesis protein TonB
MSRSSLALAIVLAVASGGCWLKTNKRPLPVPAPPAPAMETPPVPPPVPEPVPQQPAPQPPAPEPAPPEEPVVKPARKKPSAKPPQPEPETAAPETPAPQPVPQLGVLITLEQRKQYEADYAASHARAQHVLVLAAEYKLTPAQSESVGRIQSFLRLAENVHDRDPATAAQLAHRAGLLAEDLLKTLQ